MEKIQKYTLFNSEKSKTSSKTNKDGSKAFLLPYIDENFFASAQSQSRSKLFNRSPSENTVHTTQSVFLNDQFSQYLKKHQEEQEFKPLYRKDHEPSPSISYSKTIEGFSGTPNKKLIVPLALREKSDLKHQILKTATRTLWNALNQLKSGSDNLSSNDFYPDEKSKEIEVESLRLHPSGKHKKQASTDSLHERNISKSISTKEINKARGLAEHSLSVSSLQKIIDVKHNTEPSMSPRIENRLAQPAEDHVLANKTNYSPIKISARYRKELKGLQMNQISLNKKRYLSSFLPPMREEVKKKSDYFYSKVKWEEKYLIKLKKDSTEKQKNGKIKKLNDS